MDENLTLYNPTNLLMIVFVFLLIQQLNIEQLSCPGQQGKGYGYTGEWGRHSFCCHGAYILLGGQVNQLQILVDAMTETKS